MSILLSEPKGGRGAFRMRSAQRMEEYMAFGSQVGLVQLVEGRLDEAEAFIISELSSPVRAMWMA